MDIKSNSWKGSRKEKKRRAGEESSNFLRLNEENIGKNMNARGASR